MSIIRMTTADAQDIYVQVKDVFDYGIEAEDEAGGRAAAIEDKLSRFEQVGQQVMTVCTDIYKKYQEATEGSKPDELTLKFSVTLAGKMGIPFVSEGSAEGTFEVTAKWGRTS